MHAPVLVEVRLLTLMIYELNDSLLVSPVTDVVLFFVWLSRRARYTKIAAMWLQNSDLGAQNVPYHRLVTLFPQQNLMSVITQETELL